MFLASYIFWILLNAGAGVTLEIALIGLPVAGAVTLLAFRCLDWNWKRERMAYVCAPRFALYALYLAREVVLSNLAVIRLIYSGRIDPVVLTVKPRLSTRIGMSLFANSITLTPGTFTLGTARDSIRVYALTEDFARGTLESDMADRIRRMEGGAGDGKRV